MLNYNYERRIDFLAKSERWFNSVTVRRQKLYGMMNRGPEWKILQKSMVLGLNSPNDKEE